MSDAFSLLTKALSAPKDQQPRLLDGTKRALANEPKVIQPLVGHLLPVVNNSRGAEAELLRTLFIDVLEIGICRAQLPYEVKTSLALTSVETLAPLVRLPSAPSSAATLQLKALVAISASLYPLVFRHLCANKTNTLLWGTLTGLRDRILRWAVDGVDDRGVRAPRGVRLSAIKFLQRVVLVQTKGGNDPRVFDPNLSSIPGDHPFLPVQQLEAQSLQLLEFLLRTMYASADSTLLTALLSLLPPIVRLRPTLATVLVPALTGWTPGALEKEGKDRSDVRATEKLVRALMYGFERSNTIAASFKPQLQQALAVQNTRMEASYRLLVEETRAKRAGGGLAIEEPSAKRVKFEAPLGVPTPPPQAPPGAVPAHLPPPPPAGAEQPIFDVQLLPAPLVIDLTIASLTTLSLPALSAAVASVRGQLAQPEASWSTSTRLLAPSVRAEGRAEGDVVGEAKVEEGEGSNPLDMRGPDGERDEDVLPDLPPAGIDAPSPAAEAKPVIAFALPPPRPLAHDKRQVQVLRSLRRLLDVGAEKLALKPTARADDDDGLIQSSRGGVWELWMILGSRLVTRADDDGPEAAAERASLGKEREAVAQWVADEFLTRWRFASLWLNEEWYNDAQIADDGTRPVPHYRQLLHHLLSKPPILASPALPAFLLSLPDLPPTTLATLHVLCADHDRAVGRLAMHTLRVLVAERPPVRDEALGQLLELCTHPDAATRNPAIAAVRQWVPDTALLADSIKSFALSLVRRLQKAVTVGPAPAAEAKPVPQNDEASSSAPVAADAVEDVKMDAAEESEEVEHEVQSRYLPPRLDLADVETEVVRQHVELVFALTKKVPELLDSIFAAYIDLPEAVRPAFELILTPLIRSMGPNNGKLLTVLRTFPPGADMLALKVIDILTDPKVAGGERQKMSGPLIALVKSLVAERSLDPRFVVTIMGELDKNDMRRQLPRIISILPGKALTPDAPPPERDMVRQILTQVVAPTPPANATPAAKKKAANAGFTPAELMVLLHNCEKESGLKATMDAIDICFSLTNIYRSEVLAAVMQQIVDEVELPTLFLRTVIKSVQLYKSLVPFVSTSLLSRLITKKVWTSPQLWEGFIRCARVMGMASYGALLQLPREQLKEIVNRPDGKLIKTGLRDFVVKRAGGNASKIPSWFSEVFPDEEAAGTPEVAPLPPSATSTPLSLPPTPTPPPMS